METPNFEKKPQEEVLNEETVNPKFTMSEKDFDDLEPSKNTDELKDSF
jgi:hypothetical protein